MVRKALLALLGAYAPSAVQDTFALITEALWDRNEVLNAVSKKSSYVPSWQQIVAGSAHMTLKADRAKRKPK